MFALLSSLLHNTLHLVKLLLQYTRLEHVAVVVPINTCITCIQNAPLYTLIQNNTVYNLNLFETPNYNFVTSNMYGNLNPLPNPITYTINEYTAIPSSDSDTNSDSITSAELQQEIVDEIAEEEESFLESEKENGRSYLGIPFLYDNDTGNRELLLNVALQSSTFLKYNMYYIDKYVNGFQSYSDKFPIHIMKLDKVTTNISNTEHTFISNRVVLKTIWLKLIQRHWKKVYAERCDVINKRKSLSAQSMYTVTGKYPYGANQLPSLKGMMSAYIKLQV